ncbi:MAG: hypothetical protein ACJA2S_003569, partial [Cyclobacteriaceae bacterium]
MKLGLTNTKATSKVLLKCLKSKDKMSQNGGNWNYVNSIQFKF